MSAGYERGIHGTHGADPARAGRGNERAAQALKRAVQQPPQHYRIDRAHPRARIWQQPDFWLNVQRLTDLREAMHSPKEWSGSSGRGR